MIHKFVRVHQRANWSDVIMTTGQLTFMIEENGEKSVQWEVLFTEDGSIQLAKILPKNSFLSFHEDDNSISIDLIRF